MKIFQSSNYPYKGHDVSEDMKTVYLMVKGAIYKYEDHIFEVKDSYLQIYRPCVGLIYKYEDKGRNLQI